MLKILFIGQFPPPEGGVTVSTRCLHDELKSRADIHIETIDIAQPRKILKKIWRSVFTDNVIDILVFCFRIISLIKKVDIVSLHVSSDKVAPYGLIALALSKVCGKKIIVRKFGGTDYNTFGLILRESTKFVLKLSDCYLCETKYLVRTGKKDKILNVQWFPNHREDCSSHQICYKERCDKGIFLGKVCKEKGIEFLCETIEAAQKIFLDIYGKLDTDIKTNYFNQFEFVSYKGQIPQSSVSEIIKRYDVLLLPSFRAIEEGYPGVIIEAFGAGLPVIATNLPGISEIVDKKNGTLINPGDCYGLSESILTIHEDSILYKKLQSGARHSALNFSSKKWADQFVRICRNCLSK